MKPTIGRIVHYQLTDKDAEKINAARQVKPGSDNVPHGAQLHIGNAAHENDVVALIVVGIHDDTTLAVNGQLFLDGNDTLWVTSILQSDVPVAGKWNWPPRVDQPTAAATPANDNQSKEQ